MINIREIRLKKSISQTDIAKKIKVSQQAVAKWENGETLPTSEKLPQLAKILGCTIDDLFYDPSEKRCKRRRKKRK